MNTAKFIDTIKRIAVETVEAMKPAAVLYGTIKKLEPIEVAIDQRLTLTGEFLIIPAHLRPYGVTVTATYPVTVKVNNELKENDRVLLLRVQGGQKFVILGRE